MTAQLSSPHASACVAAFEDERTTAVLHTPVSGWGTRGACGQPAVSTVVRMYDDTGRGVRTRIDGRLVRARHELVWDGADDRSS